MIVVSTTYCNNSCLLSFGSTHLNLVLITSISSSLKRATFVRSESHTIHPCTSANSHWSDEFAFFEIKSFPILMTWLSSCVLWSSHTIIIVSSVDYFYAIDIITLCLGSELLHIWNIFLILKTLYVVKIIKGCRMRIDGTTMVALF